MQYFVLTYMNIFNSIFNNNINYINNIFITNISIYIILFTFSSVIQIFNLLSSNYKFNFNFYLISFLKKIYFISLLITFIGVFYIFIFFFKFLNFQNYVFVFEQYNNLFLFKSVSNILTSKYIFNLDIFGIILLLIVYFVGFISYIMLIRRLYWLSFKYVYICNFIILIIYFYVSSSDIISFFLFYELLLIPSVLFVYYISPINSSIYACLHFLVWTQLGSILVLSIISYILILTNFIYFNDLINFNFTLNESMLIYFFFFLGFGFKVPIWPFYSWLLTTHVEAPTGFSIYLSGFLVKTAIYGFYKLLSFLNNQIDTSIFLSWCLLGAIDSSLKLWNQQDLKKLIAYCTVQEMNLIYSCFILGDTYLSYIGFLFCFTHALLSTLFFFLVDCVYIRYRTRSLTKVLGVFKLNPKLAWIIFISCMIFSGVPGSLKFICELFIFMAYFEISRILFFISIFFVNYIGIIGFFRCWFSVIFGDRINTLSKSYLRPKADLTRKEFNIFFFCVFLLIFSTFLLNWIQ